MKKLLSAVVGVALLPVIAFSNVQATGMGQVEGGDIYRVKNVTKGTDFSDPTNATCGDTVQFKVRIHNPGPSSIDNVKVVATLPSAAATSHTSRVTVSSTNADPLSTSDTATVKLDKTGTLAYVAGTTELLDANGAKLSTLSDAVTGAGVSIGKVGVSIQQKRFVQFKAKVNCPPVVKNIQVCELATKKIITIREDQFDASKHSKNLADCKEVVKYVQVCELATKKIITIREDQFDASKHSKNLADCAEKPEEDEIVVCDLESMKVVTIKETAFDSSKHSKDLKDCDETPVVPTELPRTGAGATALAAAASIVAAGVGYAVTARRNTLG